VPQQQAQALSCGVSPHSLSLLCACVPPSSPRPPPGSASWQQQDCSPASLDPGARPPGTGLPISGACPGGHDRRAAGRRHPPAAPAAEGRAGGPRSYPGLTSTPSSSSTHSTRSTRSTRSSSSRGWRAQQQQQQQQGMQHQQMQNPQHYGGSPPQSGAYGGAPPVPFGEVRDGRCVPCCLLHLLRPIGIGCNADIRPYLPLVCCTCNVNATPYLPLVALQMRAAHLSSPPPAPSMGRGPWEPDHGQQRRGARARRGPDEGRPRTPTALQRG